MKPALVELMRNPLLWRGDSLARADNAVPSGYALLDAELPGEGWPQGAVTELLLDHQGIGELRLLLPALQRLHKAGETVVLVAPPHVPYAPALAGAGLDPGRVVVIRSDDLRSGWWATEQILRASAAAAVLFWPPTVDDHHLRRLQVAAQDAKCLSFVFAATDWGRHSSPSPLRLELQTMDDDLRVSIRKRRGGASPRPLLIRLAAPAALASTHPGASQKAKMAKIRRLPLALKPSARFNKQYPVGPADPRIWNRALNPTDEVRRPPGVDPRGSSH